MGSAEQTRATEAMMTLSTTMAAVVARTLAEVSQEVTARQLRVLFLLRSAGSMNVRTIAEHLRVNPSNASRTCDELVTSGTVVRQHDTVDGRTVQLSLSEAGERLVGNVLESRRRLIESVVARMDPAAHEPLADALEAFSAAAAEALAGDPAGLSDGQLIAWLR